MRIIGGHDYYDSGIMYGVDPKIIFIRDKKIITNKMLKEMKMPDFKNRYSYFVNKKTGEECSYPVIKIDDTKYNMTVFRLRIVFCDTIYEGLKIKLSNIRISISDKFEYFWDNDKFVEWLDSHGYQVRSSYMQSDPYITHYPVPDNMRQFMIQNKISILTFSGEKNPYYMYNRNPHMSDEEWHNTPSGWVANDDILLSYHFQKCLAPFDAFQKLSMWVGNVMVDSGPDIVEITDDKIKLAKNGFDKFSFKKPKGMKKTKKGA